jgi:small subunit ribosomal protein S15
MLVIPGSEPGYSIICIGAVKSQFVMAETRKKPLAFPPVFLILPGGKESKERKYLEEDLGISGERKKELIRDYQKHGSDTGSPEVQVALLTERITSLSDHLGTHKKDHSSRRALLMLVGQRSALLKYLKKKSVDRYSSLCEGLGIRA